MTKMMEMNRKQVGGTHYEVHKVQPIDLWHTLSLDAFQGSILKYLDRFKRKNGLQDLQKAVDFCNICLYKQHKPINSEPVLSSSTILSPYFEQFKDEFSNKSTYRLFKDGVNYTLLGNWNKVIQVVKLIAYSEYDVEI